LIGVGVFFLQSAGGTGLEQEIAAISDEEIIEWWAGQCPRIETLPLYAVERWKPDLAPSIAADDLG
jgi:hypothetical protein